MRTATLIAGKISLPGILLEVQVYQRRGGQCFAYRIHRRFTDCWFPNKRSDKQSFKGGGWIDDGGEGLYAVVLVGLGSTFDFFSGVAVSVFGPTIARHRRVVYDKNCDYIVADIDIIETTCTTYRSQLLKEMCNPLRASGDLHTGVIHKESMINITFVGNPLEFTPGLCEVLLKHRTAL